MYKTLLVPVDGKPRSARSVEHACRIAAAFDAHVVGLFVEPSIRLPAMAFGDAFVAEIGEMALAAARRLSEGARTIFETTVAASGHPKSEWRTTGGDRAAAVAVQARYADLVVINQTDANDPGASHFADSVLLSLNRPALLVPHAGTFKHVGDNVVVCWNASAEAARAVTDALPLLKRAAKVTVMAVEGRPTDDGHGERPGADIALFLSRHGVRAEVMPTPSGGIDVGNVILSRAYDQSADLIVMGAYSHPRVRELVLGGVTRTILESMTVPVLMSH
jgi:nucleotide-binding universal stress UspA family protein